MATQVLMILALLWLPARPSGTPAAPATLIKYVPTDAHLVATIDAGSIAKAALDAFQDLGRQPFVKGSPELSRTYKQIDQKLNMGLRMLTSTMGIDPFKDLRYITVSVVGDRNPRWLVMVGGKINLALVERIAAASRAGKPQKQRMGMFFPGRSQSQPSFGFTSDGVMLAGTEELVMGALKKKPRRGELAGIVASQVDRNTPISVAVRPTRRVGRRMERMLDPPFNTLGNKCGAMFVSMRYDGTRIALQGKKRGIISRYRSILDGVGNYIAASELVLQGTLRVVDGVISPRDRGLPPPLVELARHKKSLLKYVSARLPRIRPSHSTRVDNRRRLAQLNYKGGRVAGVIPMVFLAGVASELAKIRIGRLP